MGFLWYRTSSLERAMKEIYSHAGKRRTYEFYQKVNPELANKYLKFVKENPNTRYIKFDKSKNKFVHWFFN